MKIGTGRAKVNGKIGTIGTGRSKGNWKIGLEFPNVSLLVALFLSVKVRLDFIEFAVQPPLLGNCRLDKFYVNGNGQYPMLCGDNSGHHMYIDVAGRARTDLTFVLQNLEAALYNCPDKFDLFGVEPSLQLLQRTGASGADQLDSQDQLDKLDGADQLVQDRSDYPSVSVADPDSLPQATFPTRRAWKIKVI